jgi:membrane-associated phospholipid phosphatase
MLLRIARTRGHTPRSERAVARFSALVAGTYVLNTAIKIAVGRRRPRLAELPALTGTPTALSFPSAHASTSLAGSVLYSRLGFPACPLYALSAALAYSRLYLGVHYPSDVIGGAALGAAVGLAARPLLAARGRAR